MSLLLYQSFTGRQLKTDEWRKWIRHEIVRDCFQSCSGWMYALLLDARGLCGAILGRLSHFLPPRLRTGCQSVIAIGILRHSRKLSGPFSHPGIMTN